MLTCNGCGDRLCQPCQRHRQQHLIDQIVIRCSEAAQSVRFLTFTLRANSLPLADQMARMTHCLRQIRQRKFWKENVVGGAIFLEVKIGEGSGKWHVHAHCLVEGRWMDQQQLSREWLAVTGDSSIIDIRAIPDWQMRAKYVAKYATKPAAASVLRDAMKLDEFITAIKAKRLYQCFGSWKAFSVDDSENSARTLKTVDSVSNLISRARTGLDADALSFLHRAIWKWPALKRIVPATLHPPDS